jgi:nitroreductase
MFAKTAAAEYPIHELIAGRWSPRAFAERPVEPEKLRILFEAARWAPSCFGDQPWSFVVAESSDKEGFDKLASCLMPGNAWAKNAPVLMLSVAANNFGHNNQPNRFGPHDVGLAMGNLCLQAFSMGIYVHQMGGFDAAKARQVLAIPDTHAPMAMIALGYMGDPSTLSEEQQKREAAPRQRKPQDQFVFGSTWGERLKI